MLPTAYEPVLVLFGKLYPPLLIALSGAVVSVAVEAVNYRIYVLIAALPQLERLRKSATSGWLVRHFETHPFLVVWIFALLPLPDWGARVLAALSRYSLPYYLLAFLLGRIPKFYVLAKVGEVLPVSTRVVVLTGLGLVILLLVIGLIRRHRAGRLEA